MIPTKKIEEILPQFRKINKNCRFLHGLKHQPVHKKFVSVLYSS